MTHGLLQPATAGSLTLPTVVRPGTPARRYVPAPTAPTQAIPSWFTTPAWRCGLQVTWPWVVTAAEVARVVSACGPPPTARAAQQALALTSARLTTASPCG